MKETLIVFLVFSAIEVLFFVLLSRFRRTDSGPSDDQDIPDLPFGSNMQRVTSLGVSLVYSIYHLPFLLLIIFYTSKRKLLTRMLLVLTPILYTAVYYFWRGSGD